MLNAGFFDPLAKGTVSHRFPRAQRPLREAEASVALRDNAHIRILSGLAQPNDASAPRRASRMILIAYNDGRSKPIGILGRDEIGR